MKLTLKRTIFITLAWAGLGLSADVGAAHATNFLNAFQTEVTNRVANPGSEVSKAQRKALSSAARTLSRNTKTFAADLGILASASATLNAKFTNDAAFAGLQEDALEDYVDVANDRLNGVFLWIGTNTVSKSLSNQVLKADHALDEANANTNGVPSKARALAKAFNKILPAEKKVRSLFTAPVIVIPPVVPPPVITNPPPIIPPGTPGLSPDSIGTRYVNLFEDAPVNDQTVFYFSTAQSGAQIYNVHHPEELGLWTYIRDSANTGVIMVDPDYPDNAPVRGLSLTFTTTTSGTFTGTTFFGEPLRGTFIIVQ